MAAAYLDEWYAKHPNFKVAHTQTDALKHFFHGATEPLAAAKQLTQHPQAGNTPMELQLRVSALWQLLADTAVKQPSTQPGIISILQSIRTLPRVQEPQGEGEDWIDLHNGLMWQEMMNWADEWHDAFNGWSARCLIETAASDQDQATREADWASACAFAARLDATGDLYLASDGAGLERATGAIANALEADGGSREPGHVRAAAEIFKHAASTLYKRCGDGKRGGMQDAREGNLWKGEAGFSMERWRFWGERWAWFSSNDNFSPHVRRVSEDALAAMKQAEEEEEEEEEEEGVVAK